MLSSTTMSRSAGDFATAGDASSRTVRAARDALEGRRKGVAAALPFVGPAVIASIGYMDPGNFATNIQAGAAYGYELLWVVLAANVIAMVFQAMSAKLGIVTGRNLAELCREHFPRPVVWGMWATSEIAAMATDLAEFLGGALAFGLLLHLPLIAGMAATAVLTCAILTLEKRGFRPLEAAIAALVGVIGASYLGELLIAPQDWHAAAYHLVVPQLRDGTALTLAVGIIGATIMPHTLYLHSGLTQRRTTPRDARERRLLLRFSNREVAVALGVAGFVNIAMVMMASSAFHRTAPGMADIGDAYHTLIPLLGPAAGALFLVALFASGVSSSVVGTLAGQVVMQGFLRRRVPIWVRRLVTIAPAFAIVALGCDVTRAMVLSQVVLSLVLPLPMAALLLLSSRRALLGEHALRAPTLVAASAAAAAIVALNVYLIWAAFN
ncbi:manganese/iron transporter [Burkholderia pseudomallei]|uniref:Divalent metal cation transporter MntH n=4 Tax=pseudomallei group TaxID=111527 RepID=A0A8A4E6I9_BURPE|nr:MULTISPECIES: Nramp family divalent metal transporter [pseudomallei group]EIF58969.1 manganese/iron transporter [Burkholderia pseudomallei 1258a]ABM49279.1 manganese/iron transporter, NRAMP family [Burkholderia mallei SAVP1]ABM99308.1 manganese/iron transporter, NRAMP family [Burkholderia mallei NCTC 10229]ABO03840.1 manganese/iron transporter, NRAMP family [Burkholderia mallei NCTC 10247]AIO54584.1 manganese transport protein mntH [Burkholderia mallei]